MYMNMCVSVDIYLKQKTMFQRQTTIDSYTPFSNWRVTLSTFFPSFLLFSRSSEEIRFPSLR